MQNIVKTIATCLLFFLVACSSNKKMSAIPDTFSTLVFDKQGHRGCRGLMPENTIPAMIKAVDLGVTTLEMDVVFTNDKVAILSHEPFFNHEITTGPNQKAIEERAEKTYNIYQMNFAETQQFDVGQKPHPRFETQQKIKVTKPSLAALIDSVELHLQINDLPKVNYNIETKTTVATDNLYHPAPAEFVERLMQVITSKAMENRVIIQSFDIRTLQIVHKKYNKIKTALLIEDYDKRAVDEQLSNLGFTPAIYSPNYMLVNKELIDACHNKKMKIIPWTVNDTTTITNLRQLGVDGIISDYPDRFTK